MKSFKEFILEYGYNTAVTSIDKMTVNLDDPHTITELNKNLSISLSRGFSNPLEALHSAKKILSMYGLELPKVEFHPKEEGVEKFELVHHHVSGETMNAEEPKNKKNKTLILKYKLDQGKFIADARVSP